MRRSSSGGGGMDARASSGASVMCTVYFDASEDSLPGSPASIGALQGSAGQGIAWENKD